MVNRSNDDQFAGHAHIRSNGFTQRLWQAKGAIALALMAILLPACNTNQPQATAPAPPGNVTTEEVADNANALIGKTVTVRSEVAAVGTNAFTIKDEEFFGTETIVVVNATGKPFVVPADDDSASNG